MAWINVKFYPGLKQKIMTVSDSPINQLILVFELKFSIFSKIYRMFRRIVGKSKEFGNNFLLNNWLRGRELWRRGIGLGLWSLAHNVFYDSITYLFIFMFSVIKHLRLNYIILKSEILWMWAHCVHYSVVQCSAVQCCALHTSVLFVSAHHKSQWSRSSMSSSPLNNDRN